MSAMWTSKLGNRFPKALIDSLDEEHHRVLQQLRKQPANARCADCGEVGTTWASVSIGAFLCVRCADIHRAMGTHISKVKGCSGTYLWGPDEISRMQEIGNAVVAATLGGDATGARPAADASKEMRMEICRKKYDQRVWAQPAATSKSQGASAVEPAQTKRLAERSLLDDLFQDFDTPIETGVLQVRHQQAPQGPVPVGISHEFPCRRDAPACPQDFSLLDQLFKDDGTASKDHTSGMSTSAASEDEVDDVEKCVFESPRAQTSEGFSFAAAPRVQQQSEADIWAGFGSWSD